jgi:hypothetical protein
VWFAHSDDRGQTWEPIHLAGPFDLNTGHLDVTDGPIGGYQGIAPIGTGFGVLFAQATGRKWVLDDPETHEDLTDVVFARLDPVPCAATPEVGCQPSASQRGRLALRNTTPDDRDQLTWKWTASALTPKSDFGAPLTTSTYALCLYDATGLRLTATAPFDDTCPAKPCWKETKAGFKYRDKDLTPDGLARIKLRAGGAGKGKISVRGNGANLGLPSPPLSTPVRVQLKRSDASACWEATFSTPTKNDTTTFKARSD